MPDSNGMSHAPQGTPSVQFSGWLAVTQGSSGLNTGSRAPVGRLERQQPSLELRLPLTKNGGYLSTQASQPQLA